VDDLAQAALLALTAGGLGGAGAVSAIGRPPRLAARLQRIAAEAPLLVRAGVAALGRDDSPARRRRLRLAAGGAGLVIGVALAGLTAGVGAALLGAWGAPRMIRARRARPGRGVEAGAAEAALAIAGALSAGATVRAAISVSAAEVHGPIARELGRTAWELEVGATTDAALDRLRLRCASRSVNLIVAAIQVQHRSGGDLARLLRDVATAIDDERRVQAEARAATSQARLTSAIVIGMPAVGIAFAALASPGIVGRIVGSGIGLALLATAFALQVGGALVIRRLAHAGP